MIKLVSIFFHTIDQLQNDKIDTQQKLKKAEEKSKARKEVEVLELAIAEKDAKLEEVRIVDQEFMLCNFFWRKSRFPQN